MKDPAIMTAVWCC